MMVDKTGVGPDSEGVVADPESGGDADEECGGDDADSEVQQQETSTLNRDDSLASTEKSPAQRTKSNQRWMKLRTTVQLSGAISSTIQKSKPPLKREDSFLKRFSTRQVPETQETVDTGDDGEGGSGSQSGNADSTHRRRRRKKAKRHRRTVVNPDENFYFYWLFLITVCVLYNLWTLIVRQSFPELQSAADNFWFVCDVFTDIVFVLDVAVQLRTGYLEQGLMVYNSKKLAGHYISSRAFLLDLSALLPLDWLQINVGVNPMLRFPRFLKVYRVYNYYYIVESRTVYPNLWRVVNLIHILLILAHWFGCFYYLLSEAEGFQGDWVYPYRPGDYATLTRKYLGSLYWSTLTLTTIGDLPTPETNAEYVFTIVSYLIGVFIFATIVGQVGNVITNRNANRLEFERLLDGAKTYMRHHKVPGGMKRRVLRWYDYSWSRGRIQGGGDINTALGLLPDKLKTELALHVNLSVLKKVTIFHECQPEFLHDLVLKMKAYIFTPGDLICRKGEVAREMFIIADGILEVKSETGRVLTTMKAGDFFGEIGILNLDGLNKRTADVRSVGYSELFSLSREDVLAAMKDYPEAQEILQTLGRKRLMEARNINRAGKGIATCEPGKQSITSPISPEMFDSRTGKRIVEKICSDVKGLKNVLRKSRRGTRSKDECLELQPLTNVTSQQEEGPTSSKGILCRMPRVWSDETSQEDEPSSSETKIGAGLPLLQRLKLLKEKQDNEAAAAAATESKKQSVSSTAGPTSPKEEPEPAWQNAGLPLLQRILMLKQKEDREAAAMQTTANMTAQVLASTVRTQHKSPPLSITKLSKSGKEDNSSDDHIPKSCISKRVASQKKSGDNTPGKNGSVSWKDIESSSTESTERKLSVKSSHSSEVHVKLDTKKPVVFPVVSNGTEEKKGEKLAPWTLLKNSTCVKSVSDSAKTIKTEDMSHTTHTDNSTTSHGSAVCTECLPGPSHSAASVVSETEVKPSDNLVSEPNTSDKSVTVCSVSKQSDSSEITECENAIVLPAIREKSSVKSSTLAQDKMNAQSRLILEDNNIGQSSNRHKSLFLKFDSRKDKKGRTMDLYRVSSLRTRPPLVRFQNESKIYKSIDDLSPEYSGLPFVKKLKILNERQKLAELEKNAFLRSSSLDSGGGIESGDYNPMFDTSSLTRSHSEAIAIEVVLRNQMLAERLALQSDETAQQQRADAASALLSPESNETAERRNLKSILKNLSSGSLIHKKSNGVPEQTSLPLTAVTSRTVTTSVDLRKLMRAQTVEGYAARHSKLTKSVTFNRDTLQSPPSSATSSALTEGTNNLLFPVNKSSVEIEEKLASRLCVPSEPHTVRDSSSITSHANHVLGSSNGLTLPGNCNTAATSPDLIPLSDSLTSNINESTNVSKQVISGSGMPSELFSTIPITTPTSKQVQPTFKDPKEIELTKKQLQTTWIERPQAKQKNFFRPGSILLPTHASQEEEYFGGILGGIKEIIKNHLEEIQSKFQTRFHDLEMEVKKRDDIIAQLQERIQELEQQAQLREESSECDDISDSPFMRGDSVDTVLTSPRPSIRSSAPWSKDRRSWEDHSEEENLELMDLPRSITPQSVWNSTTVEIGSDSSSSCSTSEADDVFSPENLRFQNHNQDWEVQMLAEELDRREELNNRQQQMLDLPGRNVQTCVRRRAISFDSVSRERSVRSQRTGSVDYHELKKTKETSRTPPKKQRLHSAQSLEEKNDSAGKLSSLYRRSLSIGTLHNSLSSSLLRGLGNLIRSNPQSTPLTYSPDILPTISRSCPTPPPPPQPPDI